MCHSCGAADLATNALPPGLIVVHDACGCGDDYDAKLQAP